MVNEIEKFVVWLRKYIKDDKEITGKELAGLIDVDPTTISSYIRGRTKPDLETREKIIEVLGVDRTEITKVNIQQDTPPPAIEDTEDWQAFKSFYKFQNKHLAAEICAMLLEAEKKSSLFLARIAGIIEAEIKKEGEGCRANGTLPE